MGFEQIRPMKGYELVTEQIKKRILEGELPPGAKLASVVDLAAEFGVGRSTIREALSALKAMGFVEIRQGGGSYVCRELPSQAAGGETDSIFWRADSLKELVEVRKILETGCASLAARNRTEDDLAELERILAHMEEHLDDEAEGERADVLFHLQIARASHNSLLMQLMESLSHRLHETMKQSRRLWFYGQRAKAKRLWQEHSAIVAAIRERDEAKSFDRMMSHLAKVEHVLNRALAGADTDKK